MISNCHVWSTPSDQSPATPIRPLVAATNQPVFTYLWRNRADPTGQSASPHPAYKYHSQNFDVPISLQAGSRNPAIVSQTGGRTPNPHFVANYHPTQRFVANVRISIVVHQRCLWQSLHVLNTGCVVLSYEMWFRMVVLFDRLWTIRSADVW